MVEGTDFVILYMNPAAQRVFGSDLKGQPCYKMTGTDRSGVCKDCQTKLVLSGEIDFYETEHTVDDKTYRIRCTPYIDENGKRVGTVKEFNDITAELLNREVQDLFTGSHFHDLRNDLAIVDGNAGLLPRTLARFEKVLDSISDSTEKDEMRKYLETAKRQATTLDKAAKKAMNRQKAFQKTYHILRTGESPYECKVVDTFDFLNTYLLESGAEHVNGMITTHHRTVPAFKNDYRIIVSDNLAGTFVRIDPDTIHSVFENLLGNAVKYSDSARGVNIMVKAEKRNDSLSLSISDKGRGIPNVELSHIFELGYRLIRDRKDGKTEGTGLGLWIVEHHIRNHGGKIEVYSTEGDGTTFNITLPFTSEPEHK